MRIDLVARTVILAGYLFALGWHGFAGTGAKLTAVALVVLWAVAALRDRKRQRLTVTNTVQPA